MEQNVQENSKPDLTATTETAFPPLIIRDVVRPVPIVQGGMGVGISMAPLARAVSAVGGLGTLSSVAMDRLVSRVKNLKLSTREAVRTEVTEAKHGAQGEHPVAINIMVAVANTYEDSVLGAMDGGVDVIVSGAGLPLQLPNIVNSHPRAKYTAIVPIVSSGRAAELICKRWIKSGRAPDAVIVEGPEAGGHLGWKSALEVLNPANRLENILNDVLEVARRYGNFPVIAAGGIYTRQDIARILGFGAAGVQLGTRFLATKESGASEEFKHQLVSCTPEDIMVAEDPGSPCGLPFRVLRQSPMYKKILEGLRAPKCDKGYLLFAGKCQAIVDPKRFFCICNGLLSSAGYNPDEEPELYTVGSSASRIDRILSVAELMSELTGRMISPLKT